MDDQERLEGARWRADRMHTFSSEDVKFLLSQIDKLRGELAASAVAAERSARVDVSIARRLEESLKKQFALEEENAALQKDKERLDFLEEMSRRSRTGVTLEDVAHAGEFRVLWYHMINDTYKSAREAIDRAITTAERMERDASGK